MEKIITVCAWCPADMVEPMPTDPAIRVSHGICPDCAAKLEAESIALGRRLNGTVRVYVGKPACQKVQGI